MTLLLAVCTSCGAEQSTLCNGRKGTHTLQLVVTGLNVLLQAQQVRSDLTTV